MLSNIVFVYCVCAYPLFIIRIFKYTWCCSFAYIWISVHLAYQYSLDSGVCMSGGGCGGGGGGGGGGGSIWKCTHF